VTGVWAVVPVKELKSAKQRLSSCLSPEERRVLATVMLEDVLDAASAVRQLAGLLVITVDPVATSLASRYGARIVTEGAREGHTGAVAAAARLLAREGQAGMMDNARRHSATVVGRDRCDACGAPSRACLHHCARA
jgi:2-phospho-L-lactate guanylyltransferase